MRDQAALGDGVRPRDWAILGAILVVALVARLVGLNGPLWFDEIISFDTHLSLPWGQMMQSYSMNHHYFYDVQAKLVMGLFGDAPWVVRVPALLFGLGAIAAMWVLARQISGVWIAHLVALLLAVSFHHIWFSQNARGYSELAFWSSVGMILFLRGLAVPSWRLWIGFGLCLAAATYTHLTGAFFFAALGLIWLVVLVQRRAEAALLWRPLVGAAVGVGLLVAVYAPLIPSLRTTVGGIAGTSAVDVMQEYQNPVWTVVEAVRTGVGGAGPLVSLLAVAVVGLSLLGGIISARRAPWFAVAVLAHILLTMAVLMALGMRVWPRFFFVDIGFLMLLVVLGVQALCSGAARRIDRSGWAGPGFALAAVAMVGVSFGLAAKNYRAPKQDLVGAIALVSSLRTAGEPVYAVGPGAEAFIGHYKADWQAITDEAGYLAARAQAGPALFVVAFPGRILRRYTELDADRLSGALQEVRWLPGTLGDGAVLVLQRD